ncbi:MAG: hypothetical protein Q7R95_09560 [bacterium]|nr:hypothetical protein [bacterium]
MTREINTKHNASITEIPLWFINPITTATLQATNRLRKIPMFSDFKYQQTYPEMAKAMHDGFIAEVAIFAHKKKFTVPNQIKDRMNAVRKKSNSFFQDKYDKAQIINKLNFEAAKNTLSLYAKAMLIPHIDQDFLAKIDFQKLFEEQLQILREKDNMTLGEGKTMTPQLNILKVLLKEEIVAT